MNALKEKLYDWRLALARKESPIAQRAFDAGRSGLTIFEAWSDDPRFASLRQDVEAYGMFHGIIKRTWRRTVMAWLLGQP